MRRIAIAVVVLTALVVLGLFLIGGALSRSAPAVIGPPPNDTPLTTVLIPTPRGQTVSGWFARGQPAAGAVLLLHGVRGNRLLMLDRARFLMCQGYAVLLIDLPGHGESPAEHITFGMNEADGVRAAVDFLTREAPGEKIGVIGVSLGAASFVLSGPGHSASAVVLESMYPTIAEAVADRLRLYLGAAGEPLAPLLLWQLPLRLGVTAQQLRPIDGLAAVKSSVLIAAGSQDQHTTLAETQRLFAAAQPPKTLWVVEGAAHVDLHAFNRPVYEAKVGAFLAEHLRAQ